MASLSLELHADTPERYKLSKIVSELNDGAVVLYPADTGFALGCALMQKNAIERIRQIRQLPKNKHLTFLCDSLSHVAEYAKVSNRAYRAMKRLVPGPFTFILPATKAVPHYVLDPKRKTTGIRVPRNALVQSLLHELGSPIISITARSDDGEYTTPEDIVETFAPLVDVVVTASDYQFDGESTLIDMTSDDFVLLRRGAGVQEVCQEIPELFEL
ncbi:MAG: L-threonylcarbamoyladenylate synthase [Bacteroidota bacterium]|nr:L-threonylcarbamoyladenylate synthase [Candidatus Kapabacteria bacterium]MDW8219264.1 L-threonylcarbamoyladenylate synthase [Bacteroidota bacterium]